MREWIAFINNYYLNFINDVVLDYLIRFCAILQKQDIGKLIFKTDRFSLRKLLLF